MVKSNKRPDTSPVEPHSARFDNDKHAAEKKTVSFQKPSEDSGIKPREVPFSQKQKVRNNLEHIKEEVASEVNEDLKWCGKLDEGSSSGIAPNEQVKLEFFGSQSLTINARVVGSTEGTTKFNTISFVEDDTESLSESFIQIDQKHNQNSVPPGG
jgi:hypothetical protein